MAQTKQHRQITIHHMVEMQPAWSRRSTLTAVTASRTGSFTLMVLRRCTMFRGHWAGIFRSCSLRATDFAVFSKLRRAKNSLLIFLPEIGGINHPQVVFTAGYHMMKKTIFKDHQKTQRPPDSTGNWLGMLLDMVVPLGALKWHNEGKPRVNHPQFHKHGWYKPSKYGWFVIALLTLE